MRRSSSWRKLSAQRGLAAARAASSAACTTSLISLPQLGVVLRQARRAGRSKCAAQVRRAPVSSGSDENLLVGRAPEVARPSSPLARHSARKLALGAERDLAGRSRRAGRRWRGRRPGRGAHVLRGHVEAVRDLADQLVPQ